jgi:MoaA/NifB/PqqE/SkfB family radical SAM enzyme
MALTVEGMMMPDYTTRKICAELPRLPLDGFLDLTYRCNNNCRHCWLYTPNTLLTASGELVFDEITRIADEAHMMGCRSWSISGGEPMLRTDFAEIFDYLTRNRPYALNTNGTLIDAGIAKLMKRKGSKMVALYGATAEVHDRITRTPGSFDAFMRGCSLLKDAGAEFIVQVIPMKDNWRQFGEMMKLAESLSRSSRIGAAWLYLSASGGPAKNREILEQRLSARELLEIEQPDISCEEAEERYAACRGCARADDDRLFAACISSRRDFHIDPYGQASFCSFIKDPALRYDLGKGGFREFWDTFIPSLADKIRGGNEYLDNCGSCGLRKDCRWCGVYAYLENRRYSAKVDYLCELAGETGKFREEWQMAHRRYFRNAGVTIQVDSDIPFEDTTFDKAVSCFEVSGPGDDLISIRHHFSLPDIANRDLGAELYRNPPWAIYRKDNSWIYIASSQEEGAGIHQISVFNNDHSRGRIYNSTDKCFRSGGQNSLFLYPTDQILIARILSNKTAFYLHSAGVIYDGHGLLFVGHSESGKTTTVNMLKDRAEILCDDRNILRKQNGIWMLYGTWSHGEAPDVSPGSAPLKAIFFLEKAEGNCLMPLDDKNEALSRLLACVIKPFVDSGWWEKTLSFVGDVAANVPCYRMLFDKSGKVISLIESVIFKEKPLD